MFLSVFQSHYGSLNKNQSDANLASMKKFFLGGEGGGRGISRFTFIRFFTKKKITDFFLSVSKTDCVNEESLANGIEMPLDLA